MDLENHKCGHKVYTIEVIFINLHKHVYKIQRLHSDQECNSAMHFDQIISFMDLENLCLAMSFVLFKQISSTSAFMFV